LVLPQTGLPQFFSLVVFPIAPFRVQQIRRLSIMCMTL
jgi:hypothetical protein